MSATAGKTPLNPPGEAGHEVRLDEAEDDPAVGLHVVAIHQHGLAVAARAREGQALRVVGVVVHHPVPGEDRGPDHAGSAPRGVGPV